MLALRAREALDIPLVTAEVARASRELRPFNRARVEAAGCSGRHPPGETGPPAALLRSLVDGPSCVAGVEWHDEVELDEHRAAAAAARGAPEVHLVLADVQTAGRGRQGQVWQAPPDRR